MMDENWAKNIADEFLAAEDQEKKRKKAEQGIITREQQQRAADEKARRELVTKLWGELRSEMKAAVKQIHDAAKRANIIQLITTPSDEIKASVIGKERAIKLTLDGSTGIVKCEGFNGGSFDISDTQFDPRAKSRSIIESLIKPRTRKISFGDIEARY
jgi:hypothetical protein